MVITLSFFVTNWFIEIYIVAYAVYSLVFLILFSAVHFFSFQEIVPLNAGNVLVEDNEPATRWLTLINQALNRPVDVDSDSFSYSPSPSAASVSPQSATLNTSMPKFSKNLSTSSFVFQKSSLKVANETFRTPQRRQLTRCNCPAEVNKKSCRSSCFTCQRARYVSETDSSEEEEDEEEAVSSGFTVNDLANAAVSATSNQLKYNLVASKQMVGIFVTVWARKDLVQHVGHLRLSSVGRGVMGYLGNKVCFFESFYTFTCAKS